MPKTILCVEDDQDIQDLYKEFLTPEYKLYQATIVLEGMQYLINYKPIDLLISDFRFKGNHIDNLIQTARTFEVPILMISGRQRDAKYYDRFLLKPFEYDTFMQNIKEMIK